MLRRGSGISSEHTALVEWFVDMWHAPFPGEEAMAGSGDGASARTVEQSRHLLVVSETRLLSTDHRAGTLLPQRKHALPAFLLPHLSRLWPSYTELLSAP